jgi:hypothetical protein
LFLYQKRSPKPKAAFHINAVILYFTPVYYEKPWSGIQYGMAKAGNSQPHIALDRATGVMGKDSMLFIAYGSCGP